MKKCHKNSKTVAMTPLVTFFFYQEKHVHYKVFYTFYIRSLEAGITEIHSFAIRFLNVRIDALAFEETIEEMVWKNMLPMF